MFLMSLLLSGCGGKNESEPAVPPSAVPSADNQSAGNKASIPTDGQGTPMPTPSQRLLKKDKSTL